MKQTEVINMKTKCPKCNRMVGTKKTVRAKHRTGRSRPNNVKPVCEGGVIKGSK